MTRQTFVVQVHPDGISTLENLATHERIQVVELAALGTQIAQWLDTTPAAGEPSELERTAP